MLDDPEIQQVFLEESEELLERFRVVVVRAPELSVEDGERLFVVFHSFKGNLTVVGLTIYAEAARGLEKLTGLFSREGEALPDEVVGLALEAFADFDRLVAAIRGGVHTDALPQPGDWTLRAHELAASIERERETVRLADAPTPVVTLPRPSLPPTRSLVPERTDGNGRGALGPVKRAASERPSAADAGSSAFERISTSGSEPGSTSSSSSSSTSSSMALRRIDAAVWICRFRIVEDCPLVQSTLSLATQRLLEVGELLSLEKSGDRGLRVSAKVRSDAESGALARSLVMSWIDDVTLERETSLVPQEDLSSAGPALVRREALLREIMTELGAGIRASEQVLRALCRGELEPTALAKAEIALSELGIAAGALGFAGLGALALELGVSLGGARPSQLPGSGLLESTSDALALILDWQEILDDPEAGFALARALRAARGAPPVVRLEGAWLADLPDSQSRLEPVRLTHDWDHISGGLGLLADIRAAGSRGSAGRGRLRGACSAGMTSREFRAVFWISSSRSNGEPLRDELATSTPASGVSPGTTQQWFVPYDDLDRLAVAYATIDEEARRILAPVLESLRSAPLRDLADHLQVCAHGFRHGRRSLQLELSFHDDGSSIDRRILELSREPLTECLLTVLRSELTRGEDDGVAEIAVSLASDRQTLTARFDFTDDRSPESPRGPALDAAAEFVQSYSGVFSHQRDGHRSILELGLSIAMTAVRVRSIKVAGKRLAIVPAHLEIGVIEGAVVLCGDGRVPLREWPSELCPDSPVRARAAVVVGDGESGAALPIDSVGEVQLATVRGCEAELGEGITCPLVDLPSLIARGLVPIGEATP